MKKLLVVLCILVAVGLAAWALQHTLQQSTPANIQIDTPLATSTIPEASETTPDYTDSIGQLFMIGHWADTPVASTTDMIRQYGFGGVIVMSAPTDPHNIRQWTREWNEASIVPLIVAIDQEGGPVTRLQGDLFVQTSQRDISTTAEAYAVGNERGQELAALGITMNFAPVLDTATKPDSFMYARVFPQASTSAVLGAAMIRGMADAGIIAAPKHFPGHADTPEDSHTVLPHIAISHEQLPAFTAPFTTTFDIAHPPAIMTAHVLFPEIDSLPASLSPFFLTTYLRDELHYQGVIITDDMSMDSVDATWGATEATLLALQAGADMVLFAAEPPRAIAALEAVTAAYQTDPAFQVEVNKHLARISTIHE